MRWDIHSKSSLFISSFLCWQKNFFFLKSDSFSLSTTFIFLEYPETCLRHLAIQKEQILESWFLRSVLWVLRAPTCTGGKKVMPCPQPHPTPYLQNPRAYTQLHEFLLSLFVSIGPSYLGITKSIGMGVAGLNFHRDSAASQRPLYRTSFLCRAWRGRFWFNCNSATPHPSSRHNLFSSCKIPTPHFLHTATLFCLSTPIVNSQKSSTWRFKIVKRWRKWK